MKIGTLFTIDEYTGPHTEFVDLYNKWQRATAFLSTGNCGGKEWDELILHGKEHQDEVKEVIKEFLLVDGNEGNWMAMSVLRACFPEVDEIVKVEGYIHPKDYHKFLMEWWDYIFYEHTSCGNEFPYFGASYPDACCIDGYLWDLDSYDEGLGLTSGGDEPCPFCNEEKWLENVVETIFETREEALAWRDMIAERWDCKIKK